MAEMNLGAVVLRRVVTNPCRISYVVPLPLQTKYIALFSSEYNRWNLVQHGNITTYEMRLCLNSNANKLYWL